MTLDGTTLATSVSGTLRNLVDLQPMAIRACTLSGLGLSAGPHLVSFPGGSPFVVTGLVAQSAPATPPTSGSGGAAPRSVRVTSWSPAQRTLAVGAGSPTYLQVAQNFNPGWAAELDGRALTPVRLDGWQQGWLVPAGAAGTIVMQFAPDHAYRAGLLVGGLLLMLLALLAFGRGNRSTLGPVGPRRPLPRWILGLAAVLIAVSVGGWLAVVLVPLLLGARRWGSRAMAVVAGAAFIAAGALVAWDPSAVPGTHQGAFGGPAQAASVVALCAVLSAVVVDGRRDPCRSRERCQSDRAVWPSWVSPERAAQSGTGW